MSVLPRGLYPVITEKFCKGRSSLDVLQEVINGGAKIVQLREKKISKRDFFELATKYKEITLKNQVKLIINDHIDIAIAIKADGVHLGQDDLPCQTARELSKELIIGISTHNENEIIEATKHGASYINIGPLFSTNTKETCSPLGINYLKNIKTSLPFSVMGGIKKHHLIELINLGVGTIAMVTEITEASNITEKVIELSKCFNQSVETTY